MIKIPLGGGRYAQIDDKNYRLVSKHIWSALKDGRTFYAITHTKLRNGKTTILKMHRLIMNVTKSQIQVDHKDNDGLNNQEINLRLCTQSQNNMNSVKRKGTRSIYKGVSWVESRNKWGARIGMSNQIIFLGYFSEEVNAGKAYDKAARKYFGEFARPNFP